MGGHDLCGVGVPGVGVGGVCLRGDLAERGDPWRSFSRCRRAMRASVSAVYDSRSSFSGRGVLTGGVAAL